jgi:hypothetical protein
MDVLREPTTGPKAPTPEEMAIIAVAIEQAWPRPSVEEEVAQVADSAWKFANRWWANQSVNRRGRPTRQRRPN